MEVYKPVKDLKSFCIEKIVDTYNINIKFSNLYHVNNAITAIQNLTPSLAKLNFYKGFKENESDFGKLLWFFYHFIWNCSIKRSLITEPQETLLTNWLGKSYNILGAINFIGLKYTNGNLCFWLAFGFDNSGPNFKEHELSHHMINYQVKLPEEIKDSCHKLVRLTVFKSCYHIWRRFPIFFDVDKVVLFDFYKTLEFLGHPAFICKARTYYYFIIEFVKEIAENCDFYNYKNIPDSTESTLSIIKTVSDTNHKKCKSNFKRLCKTLENLILLDGIELNLVEISDKLKKSIIKSLNKNLINFKIFFRQPINFLLYIGKRFENLQRLEVAFLGRTSSEKHSKSFDKLNKKKLLVFQNLKYFKLYCNWWEYEPCPFMLNTILTILEGCQKTLTSLELEFYPFSDIKEIVKFICSKNIPLKYIKFKSVYYLTDGDVLKIVKLDNLDDVIVKIINCKSITPNEQLALLAYVSQHNLKKKIIII